MYRFFHTLGLLLVILPLAAQMPDWYNATSRKMHYPQDVWYTGYTEGQQQRGEALEEAFSRLKDAARVELVSSIRTTVEQSISNRTESNLKQGTSGFDEQVRESFVNETRISSGIRDIPGLQVDAWRNPQTGDIAAFAYVKKNTLIRQMEKKITVGLTKIETSMDQIDQLVVNGQKMQARELAEKTVSQFTEIDETQKLLASVDENADEESLQLQETRTLQQRLTGLVAQLKNGINVFLVCNAKLFNETYSALKGEIQGELSKLGCTFVNSAAQSDWAVYVEASAREYNKSTFGEYSTYFVYIDAKISIDKTTTGQRIYEEQLEPVKGSWTTNFVDAARYDGYKKISPIISNTIKAQIQK